MNKITKNNTLKEIINRPEFSKYKKMIEVLRGEEAKLINNLTLEEISNENSTWILKDIIDGLNFVLEKSEKNIFSDIYSKDEMKNDSSKKMTGIFSFLQNETKPFVVVCAGGGYSVVASIVEAFPVAKRIYELGYSVFTLTYRTGNGAHYPNPIDDLAQALNHIILNEYYDVDKNNYAISGFSAAGHLVSCFGTKKLGYLKYKLPKPNALFLAYPVITMGEFAHKGSRKELLKEDENNKEIQKLYSTELNIDNDYPRTYIWHCREDNEVDYHNSVRLKEAFDDKKVKYIYHSFPGTAHGWGLGTKTAAQGWVDEAIEFWQNKR